MSSLLANLEKNLTYYLLLLAIGIGLITGASVAVFPPLLIVTAVLALFILFLFFKRPEITILGLLVLSSTVLGDESNLSISLGFGHIYLTDILLLPAFALIAVRWLFNPDFRLMRTPMDIPLLGFVGLALLSTSWAIIQSSITLQESLGEVRVVLSYLVFFAITNLLRDEKQLGGLVKSIPFLATIVATAMIYQFFVGSALPFLPGRVETLQTRDTTFVGITRVLPPGQSIVLVSSIVISALLALKGERRGNALIFIQGGLSGLAVVISFNRTFWVMTVLALIILSYLIRNRELPRLVGFGLIALSMAVLVVFLTSQVSKESKVDELLKATTDRFTTLFRPRATSSESSLQFRQIENQYAVPQIMAHPLLGLGMGALYRPFNLTLDYRDMRGYIHNGHFHIMMKAGMLAYLCVVWFSAVFLFRSFRYWRLIRDVETRAYVLGFALAYVGILVGSIYNPMLVQPFWTPLIGVMFGFNEAIIGRTLAGIGSLQVESTPVN